MGVACTLRVSRDDALLALAKIQFKNTSDEDVGNMLDLALTPDRGDALNNVLVTHDPRPGDNDELQRAVENL